MDKKGFTLIEILIVAAITAVLSGLAIVYSHIGQNQIALSVEESKVAQLILEAKELSVATYSQDTTACAYGVHFNYAAQTYSIFQYDSATPSQTGVREICPSVASTTADQYGAYGQQYQSGSWQVHVSTGVKLDGTGNDAIQDVMFYPPDPCAMISLVSDNGTFLNDCVPSGSAPPAQAFVYLSTTDGSASRMVSVTPAGQVNL